LKWSIVGTETGARQGERQVAQRRALAAARFAQQHEPRLVGNRLGNELRTEEDQFGMLTRQIREIRRAQAIQRCAVPRLVQ
jgi:hypothetical protein